MYYGIEAVLKPLVGKEVVISKTPLYRPVPSSEDKVGILTSVEAVDLGTDLIMTVKSKSTGNQEAFRVRWSYNLFSDSSLINYRALSEILLANTSNPVADKEELTSLRRFSDIFSKTKGDFDLVTEDGNSLPAHKTILAARSPIFAAMFNTEMKEKKSGKVVIKGYSFEALQVFVDLLYGKRHAALGKHLGALIELLDAYQIGELLDEVGRTKFRDLLSVENAADILFLGAKHRKPEIVELVFPFVKANESAVMATDKWKEWMDKGVNVDFSSAAWMTAMLNIIK